MRIPSLISSAALALTLSACNVAVTSDADAPALDVDVHDGEFATIQQFTTPGGISVWLVEEPSIPILSVRMAWQAGETNDPEGMEGLTNAINFAISGDVGGGH